MLGGAHESPPPDVRPSCEDRLDSWKEIAEYLKRSVRTVRRWETEESLPVHRHVHQSGGTVYAFKSELDAWLASRTPLASSSSEEQSSNGPSESWVPPASSSFALTRRMAIAGALLIAAVLLAVGIRQLRPFVRASSPSIRSLAVLPLANNTGDPAQAYLADGLTDGLITELAQMLPDIGIISRMSVVQYKGDKGATGNRQSEIAGDLNVDALVEGAVVSSGSRLRITARLIDASTHRTLWADAPEGELTNLVGLQKDVAHAIAVAVRGKIILGSSDRRARSEKVDPDAFRLFLRSIAAESHPSSAGEPAQRFRDAIAYCQQAIEKQPNFAAAYSRMALYYQQFAFTTGVAPQNFMPQSEAAARRAIDLDDTLAEAHAALGAALYRFNLDWSASEHEFRRALALNPNYADGHRMFSVFLDVTGRHEEAIVEAKRARQLDPQWVQTALNLGLAYRGAGQYDLAIEEFRRSIQKDPDGVQPHVQLGNTYIEEGSFAEGIAELQTAVARSHRQPLFLSSLAYAYARSGQPTKARAILDELEVLASRTYVPPSAIASIYFGLGDKRTAHALLEKACLEHDVSLLVPAAGVGLPAMRSDPYFRDLFSRMGLVR
jgi:TolB-like protein/tetratricopeptide (TPR) repeat protein